MKNINKNLILSSLILIAVFALGGVFAPTKASAEYATYRFSTPSDPNVSLYPTQPVYQPAPVIFYPDTQTNQTNTNNTSYNSQTDNTNNTNRNYSNNTTSTNTDTSNTSNNTDSNTVSNTDTSANAYKNVAANAFFGGFSFLPSGLIQWVLLAIFILLIIIVVRKVTGRDETYHNEPLKHA
jgi:hypothetical protein